MTVTWQGVPVTGPLLIFHSEIQQTITNMQPSIWNIQITTQSSGTFIYVNVITSGGGQTQISFDRHESVFDRLCTCRLNSATGAGAFPVGISLLLVRLLPFQIDFPQQILNFRVCWVLPIS